MLQRFAYASSVMRVAKLALVIKHCHNNRNTIIVKLKRKKKTEAIVASFHHSRQTLTSHKEELGVHQVGHNRLHVNQHEIIELTNSKSDLLEINFLEMKAG